MSNTNTDIKFKRSKNTLIELGEIGLNFGEPFFIDNTIHNTDGTLAEPCNAYLSLGRKPDSDSDVVKVSNSPVIKALSLDKSNHLVFYKDNGSIVSEDDTELPVNRISAEELTTEDLDASSTKKFHILCQPDDSTKVVKFALDELGIFVTNNGVMQGAAWNDYAETRESVDSVDFGDVVCDDGSGNVSLSTERLQVCPHVVSDTYGYLIGKTDDNFVPIAVSGKALVSMDDSLSDLALGDCVCAGPMGKASKMTRQEIVNYPDRILGIVCEIPAVEFIDDIEVKDRVWINIK